MDLIESTPVQPSESRDRSKRLSEDGTLARPHVVGYQVLKKIGEGAFGTVWQARENKTGKHVAIKFYAHRRGLDWTLLNREVEKLALLYTSRNIVRLIDVGWQHDPPYYVMEYLDNGSLSSLLDDGALPVEEAIRIVRAICQALVHAHGRGVLHCDLKPANVLLDPDFEPRLCDFGQSRLSQEQNPALGTLFYMAPEQADLKAVPDARWDVYALGALLFHLLTGSPPHRTPENETRLRNAPSLEDRLRVYQEIVREAPKATASLHRGVDRRLMEIVDRCLTVNPERRYANAQAVLDVLYIRDRQRRVRPLVALGGIGPGLLLVAMFFLAANLMTQAVETAEENLTTRAIEADAMSASILSRSVERELQDRLDELIQVANDNQLRAAIAASQQRGWSDREEFQHILESTKLTVDRRRSREGREVDMSWFFVDRSGYQRWRHPFDSTSADGHFAYRDYFHGRHREFLRDQLPDDIEPIVDPYVSLPFKSVVTKQNTVAMTVPVRAAGSDRILGVLGRTTSVGQLLSQYELTIRGQDGVDRMIGLIDRRNWRLLDHTGLEDKSVLKELTTEEFDRLRVDEEVIPEIIEAERSAIAAARQAGRSEREARITLKDYRDPLSAITPDKFDGEWLAAFSLVGDTGWLAVVQERKAAVLQPVYEMQRELVLYAWLGLSIAGGVVATTWYFVLRAINERGIRHWSRTTRPVTQSNSSSGGAE